MYVICIVFIFVFRIIEWEYWEEIIYKSKYEINWIFIIYIIVIVIIFIVIYVIVCIKCFVKLKVLKGKFIFNFFIIND